MANGPHPRPQSVLDATDLSPQAAMENFVRLHQSQNDYLKWLEDSFRKPHVDSYVYKKIR